MTVCSHCGADYAAGITAACRECRLAPDLLSPPSLPDAEDGPDEVAFELSDWDAGERLQLGIVLTERNVPWRWEPGPVLVTQQLDEAAVEELLDEVEADDEDDESDEDDGDGDGEGLWEDSEGEEADEGAQAAMGDLFLVADRLIRNPVNGELIIEAGRLREVVAGSSPPFGVEPLVWRRIAVMAGEITAAAGEDDGNGGEVGDSDESDDSELDVEAEIAEAARALRDFLRPYV